LLRVFGELPPKGWEGGCPLLLGGTAAEGMRQAAHIFEKAPTLS